MALNPRQNLVLIRGEDKTAEIQEVSREFGQTIVTFNSGAPYPYSSRNVEWLCEPVDIPVESVRLSISGDLLSDVEQALRFGGWIKVFHRSGDSRCCPFPALSVHQMGLPDKRSKDVLAYFRELATGASLRTDEDGSILAMKYRHLNSISRDSILSRFITKQSFGSKSVMSEQKTDLIFPFGCNMSQKAAVHVALYNPVSLIQGPPGTGKTQTILNLIANLLLEGKKVAVVSSNNSATRNVLEKLENHKLGFMAAFLGSAKNRAEFIEAQSNRAIQMPALQDGQEASIRAEVLRLNGELDKAFETKNELAAVVQQIDALRLELAHFENFRLEARSRNAAEGTTGFRSNVSARKIMEYWLAWELTPRVSGRWAVFLEKILLFFRFGLAGRAFFNTGVDERISMLQLAYYVRKIEELEGEKNNLESSLKDFRFEKRLEKLTDLSMQLLKHSLAKRYGQRPRKVFAADDIWREPEEFLEEYPVVLSTTFSVITSVQNGYLFDCLIVDEASQVDLLTGALAMACAKKLVIVGDPMQLPNVLTEQDKLRASLALDRYCVPEYARFDRHNLLSSLQAAFPGIPQTLLREHYRCHPKIIEFCNQKFYNGDLLIMTRDQGEPDVLKAYVTAAGNHARDTFNQREIDEISKTVLDELRMVDFSDIGIVSPYRMQVAKMRASFGSKEIEIDTVHKYQGREKRIMVITTVSNEVNDFR